MEKQNKIQQMTLSSASLVSQNGVENQLIKNCSDEQIKLMLAYLFVLIGLKDSEIPTDDYKTGMLRKTVLIDFIRKMLWTKTIQDIKTAFELAITKKTEVDLALYGGTFSVKMIMEIMAAYEKYKAKNTIIKDENQMNNIQRLASINNFLSEETKQKLEKLGAVEKVAPKEKPKLKHHDTHQKWLRQFDLLRRNYEVDNTNGRFIKRYGKILDLDGFFKHKAEQLFVVNEYLEQRNSDIL